MSASSLDELSAEKKTLPLILLMNVSEIPTLSLSKGRGSLSWRWDLPDAIETRV